MKKLMPYIALLFSCTAAKVVVVNTTTPPVMAQWKTDSEFGVISYEVQRGKNTTTWTKLATVAPVKNPVGNIYSYVLPVLPGFYYYRIVANMNGGVMKFYSVTKYAKTK